MQNWGFSKTVVRLMAIVGVLAGMLTILGCPSDEQGVLVASTNANIPITAVKIRALDGIAITFPAQSATVLGAVTPVTITFTNTAATPNFTLTAGGRTASGTVSFPASNSCTFTVTASTFGNAPVVPGPQVGNAITVSPCIEIDQVQGIACNGQNSTVFATVTLGTPSATSSPFQVTVSIDPATGEVTVNGVRTGVTVSCVLPTGGSGSGS